MEEVCGAVVSLYFFFEYYVLYFFLFLKNFGSWDSESRISIFNFQFSEK